MRLLPPLLTAALFRHKACVPTPPSIKGTSHHSFCWRSLTTAYFALKRFTVKQKGYAGSFYLWGGRIWVIKVECVALLWCRQRAGWVTHQWLYRTQQSSTEHTRRWVGNPSNGCLTCKQPESPWQDSKRSLFYNKSLLKFSFSRLAFHRSSSWFPQAPGFAMLVRVVAPTGSHQLHLSALQVFFFKTFVGRNNTFGVSLIDLCSLKQTS